MKNLVQAQNMLALCLFIKYFVGCMLKKETSTGSKYVIFCFAAFLTIQNEKDCQNSILQGSAKCLPYA